MNAIAHWINSKSAFVLTLLLILIGLAMGLGHAVSSLTGSHSPSMTRGASGGPCGEVLAWFAPDAPIRSANDFLMQYGAIVTYGPNEEGAYQLHFPALGANDALLATQHAGGVTRAQLNPQCAAPAAAPQAGDAS